MVGMEEDIPANSSIEDLGGLLSPSFDRVVNHLNAVFCGGVWGVIFTEAVARFISIIL